MSRRRMLRSAAALLVPVLALSSLVGGVAGAAPGVTVQRGSLVSFDGTPITYNLFLPAGADAGNPVPVILMTHGWGGSGATDPAGGRVKLLLDHGYAVLTWDQRGFGTSGGEANVDSQEFEVRDVQELITLVAGVEGIQTDDAPASEVIEVPRDCEEGEEPPCVTFFVEHHPATDPRMGMLGGSYAGGIQLMTAAADARVDAIVPEIAWHDLPQSLKPGGVLKLGWDVLLYAAGLQGATTPGLQAGQTGAYDPHIHQSLAEGVALNDWTASTAAWFEARSPARYIDGGVLPDGRAIPGITVPTMLVQGLKDTLFPINEGFANYRAIKARGVPAKMMWFCGGHSLTPLGSSCSPGAAQGARINDRIIRWFDKWVKGIDGVTTGAQIEYELPDGTWRAYSTKSIQPIHIDGTSTLTNVVVPLSGQGTAATPGGCRGKDGQGAFPSTGWVRETAVYVATVCHYASGGWVPVGTYTGPPLPNCGKPEQPVCTPTFEFVTPGTTIVGMPRIRVNVQSLSPEVTMFFKLIDYVRETNTAVVVDDQAMALKATWPGDGLPGRTYTVDLAGVAWAVREGHEIYLEVSSSSNDHAASRLPWTARVAIEGDVPVIPPA